MMDYCSSCGELFDFGGFETVCPECAREEIERERERLQEEEHCGGYRSPEAHDWDEYARMIAEGFE
ncbi:MAG: hypothetical protein LBH25_04655 [Fibromonadaceae bacterium]|jgi:predicted RNA-binding Zn-ribbon protein involved in translation (DUF1610 family)|nr:hypothetical protein [Fibromonadaceae bacterium]